MLPLMLCSRRARAQSGQGDAYTLTPATAPATNPSGGTCTGSGGSPQPYFNGSVPFNTGSLTGYGGEIGTGYGSGVPSISCSGDISTAYTWQPATANEPPPQSVIVDQECAAGYYGSADVTGDGVNGFGDPLVPFDGRGAMSGLNSARNAYLDHYSAQAGGASVTVTSPGSPHGDAVCGQSQGDFAQCWAFYTATVSPVTITLGGGAIRDSSTGNWDILIGQQCLPSLAGIPGGCKVSGYSWTVTGTTFQKWDPSTTPPTYMSGYGPLNGPNLQSDPQVPPPSWYWNEAAAVEKITCTATVTPPAGQGSPFSVTAMQKVSVEVPKMNVQALPVGTGRINNNNPLSAISAGYYLYDGSIFKGQNPDPTQDHGEFWAGSVTTPAPFPAGTWNFAQIITPMSTYTGPDGNTHNLANYGITGLDTVFPYGNSLPADGSSAGEGDPPGEQLLDANSVYNVDDEFTTYLMFMPSGGVWVPLGILNKWNFVAPGIQRPSSGHWSDYTPPDGVGTPTPGGTFVYQYNFPKWTAVDK